MIESNSISRLRRAACLLMSACLIATAASCTSSSVADNSALTLKGNEGLVGFEFITTYRGYYQIKLAGFTGKLLRMNNAPKGESVYLYKLSKGSYCVKALYWTGANHYLYLPQANRYLYLPPKRQPCFRVVPGGLTYGGTLSNTVQNFYIVDLDEFLHSLKRVYPKVYAKYVIGPKPIAHPVY